MLPYAAAGNVQEIQEFPGLGNLPEMWHILYITFTKTAPENLKFLPVYIAIYFRCVTFSDVLLVYY